MTSTPTVPWAGLRQLLNNKARFGLVSIVAIARSIVLRFAADVVMSVFLRGDEPIDLPLAEPA